MNFSTITFPPSVNAASIAFLSSDSSFTFVVAQLDPPSFGYTKQGKVILFAISETE
jgi:hypothetical protein